MTTIAIRPWLCGRSDRWGRGAQSHGDAERSRVLEILKRNKTFRRLWYGLAISMLENGSVPSHYLFIYELTGSELGIGLLFVIRMFSLALHRLHRNVG